MKTDDEIIKEIVRDVYPYSLKTFEELTDWDKDHIKKTPTFQSLKFHYAKEDLCKVIEDEVIPKLKEVIEGINNMKEQFSKIFSQWNT